MNGLKKSTNKIVLFFLLGGSFGWIIEVIYRSIMQRQIINPGFLNLPFLPIYGFSLILLMIISQTKISCSGKIIIFTLIATLLELVSGWFFEIFFHLKLWDYSKEWGNFYGWICPRYCLFWLILSSLFYLFFYRQVEIKTKQATKSRPKLIVAYVLLLLVFADATYSFYEAGLLRNNLVKYKKFFPVLMDYKIFQSDQNGSWFKSLPESIKNYSNYKLINKIFKQ